VNLSRASRAPNHLAWVFIQGSLFLPAVLPDADWTRYGWGIRLFTLFLMAWLTYCLLGNLLGLWRAPTLASSRWTAALPNALVGALFVFFSAGPLFEGHGVETKALGVCWAVLGLTLLLLAIRDARRIWSHAAVSRSHAGASHHV
jgi:hypothetical protein